MVSWTVHQKFLFYENGRLLLFYNTKFPEPVPNGKNMGNFKLHVIFDTNNNSIVMAFPQFLPPDD